MPAAAWESAPSATFSAPYGPHLSPLDDFGLRIRCEHARTLDCADLARPETPVLLGNPRGRRHNHEVGTIGDRGDSGSLADRPL